MGPPAAAGNPAGGCGFAPAHGCAGRGETYVDVCACRSTAPRATSCIPLAVPGPHRPPRAFARYAWATCAYLVGVILFGAWVRITHSGAGCGRHWPTCNGEIVPLAPSVETLIEYSHRLTSGLLGVLVVVLCAWAVRAFGVRHRATRAAWVTLGFVVVEALIGAGLVLRELVADDASTARAVVVAIHLANTLMLTAACALAAFWATVPAPPPKQPARLPAPVAIGLLAVVLTAMTGAVTALGDTLFPVSPVEGGGLFGRIRDGLDPTTHFLVRLRIVHPIVAVLAAGLLWTVPESVAERTEDPLARRLGRGVRHAAVTEAGVGLLNVALAAPGWLQIVHLMLAQGLWIVLVCTAARLRDLAPDA